MAITLRRLEQDEEDDAQLPPPELSVTDLPAGTRVRHGKHGEGIVVNNNLEGKVQIDFENGASHARPQPRTRSSPQAHPLP